MNNINQFPFDVKIGCDPELFVFNTMTAEYVSAHDLIPGTKVDPFPVECGAVQVDGTAAEFNIDPVRTFGEFDHNIRRVTEQLEAMLPEGHMLMATSCLTWDVDYFSTLPYSAVELGCMPDFDAWTGRRNPKPRLKTSPTLRTAAGHIHIGFTEGQSLQDPRHIMECRRMAQLMDWHVGAWSTVVDPDKTRRQLYGKAGACRYKTYGVEYRTLSNFWVLNPVYREEVWDRTMMALTDFFNGVTVPEDHSEEIRELINA